MSESTLFAPNLDVDIPELDRPQSAAGFDESFIEFATRMRREYENALLGWLQKQTQMELLTPFHSVSETLQRRLRRHDLRRLWWIAGTVIAGLIDGAIENSLPLRRLFARLHLNLKNLSESGERGTTPASVNAVSQGLLFHIAEAETGHTGVDLLRQRFHLKELVPDRDALLRARGAVTGRNKELFVSLGAAVGDELAVVKDVLDLELRTGDVIPEKREQSLEALSRLEETLHMLGLNGPAKAMGELLPALQSSNEGHNNSAARESTLMAPLICRRMKCGASAPTCWTKPLSVFKTSRKRCVKDSIKIRLPISERVWTTLPAPSK
jgi:chemosensory pili system protein ChpA (sensor histidine kinase/response regulator)